MKIIGFLLCVTLVYADVYMHNPRGSNDRNCERNDNRNNGNRLFDSQNNGKGGYACPRAVGGPEVKEGNMHYFVGSTLNIEWTAQHGCGPNSKTHCDIVIQYMCSDANAGLRDGTPANSQDAATDTVPDNAAQSKNKRFGMHESFEYYQMCKTRNRNAGLFTADRRLRKPDARSTRQNENGQRSGFECPEERDYYPYWQPTPWKDIAVLTSDPKRCDWLTSNSNNVKAYGMCVQGGKALAKNQRLPSGKSGCEANGFTWTETKHDLAAPFCGEAPWSRVNQLGNTLNGYPAMYNWTIPDDVNDKCVLRLRYNITTGDYPAEPGLEPFFNKAQNTKKTGFPYPMITPGDGTRLEETIRQDPNVAFPDGSGFLALALNSNQHGRTFQDRSYVFGIKARPSGIPKDAAIQNINVRGKRGNIVQAYPAVEYDFVPNALHVDPDTYVHFQWEGSDYNPRRGPNNGEGGPPDNADNNPNLNARADRSNVVETSILDESVPSFRLGTGKADPPSMFASWEDAKKHAYLGQTGCKSAEALAKLKEGNRRDNDKGNCAKLSGAPSPYFDGGLTKLGKPGRFTYMSTRNNNFSNRSQKGYIVVGKADNPAHAGMLEGTEASTRFAAFDGKHKDEAETDARRLGCFKDARGARDMPKQVSDKASPVACVRECRKAGFKFAGIQEGRKCFCANSYGHYGPATNCHAVCRGDPYYKCGGTLANMVYKTDEDMDAKADAAGMGCYVTLAACSRLPRGRAKGVAFWDAPGDADENRCAGRAKAYYTQCRNDGMATVTTTLRAVGGDLTAVYPPKGTVCFAPYADELHTGEAAHGDVCRGANKSWKCPAGCAFARRKRAPYCIKEGTTEVCRIAAAPAPAALDAADEALLSL
jgi:hypothetical protein